MILLRFIPVWISVSDETFIREVEMAKVLQNVRPGSNQPQG